MSLPIREMPAAIGDLDGVYDYLCDHASIEIADRFMEAAQRAYEFLSEHPGAGTPKSSTNPRFEGLRMWVIPEFPKYLIFYQATDRELIVRRILHGAQNIDQVFPGI